MDTITGLFGLCIAFWLILLGMAVWFAVAQWAYGIIF
jgi:hypothetical protein